MDDEIERLERLHRQDPADVEVATRLKAALLRAGRRDDVSGRYRLAFSCPQRWDDMAERSPGVRHCASCKRDVHFALSYADFDRLAAKGHCLALLPSRLPQVIEGLVDAPGRGLTRTAADPCLVEGKPRPGAVVAPREEPMMMGRVAPPRAVYGAPPPR